MNGKKLLNNVFLRGWRACLWILLANYALYIKTTAFKFVNFNDSSLVVGCIRFLSHPGNVLHVFRQKAFLPDGDPFYRPLLAVSLMIDAALGGISPVVYHATNILIHVASACLVFALLRELDLGRATAWFLALWFSVHPAVTQAVAWIPGRGDSLPALFTLAAFICFVRFVRLPTSRRYLGHLFFLLGALLTKETAVMTVPLACCYVYFLRPARRRALRAVLPGWLMVGACWALVRVSEIGVPRHFPVRSSLAALPQNALAFLQYLGKAVVPFDLSMLPTVRDTSFVSGLLGALLIAAAVCAAGEGRRRSSCFGLAWFLLFLLPPLAVPNEYYPETRLYMPVIGLLPVFGNALTGLATLRHWKNAAIAAPVLALFALAAFRHSDCFVSSLVFWTEAARLSPHSSCAHLGLGREYLQLKLLGPAEVEFETSLALDPSNVEARLHLDIIHAWKRKRSEAERQLARGGAGPGERILPAGENKRLSGGNAWWSSTIPKRCRA